MKAKAKPKEPPQQPLTIFLLKPGITEPEHFLKAPSQPIEVTQSGLLGLYARENMPVPVKWAKFFAGAVEGLDLKSQSVGAVLHAQAGGRDFALTFGYGRSLLLPGSYEPDFGFRVTLNAVDPAGIRSITRSSFDAISSRSNIRAGEPARLHEFGLSPDRDLLRAIEGVPLDQSLSCRLAGADALKLWARTNVAGVISLLDRCLQLYQQPVPKGFEWLNSLRPINDPIALAGLNHLLLETIANPAQTTMWLLEPDIVNVFDLEGYSFSSNPEATPDPYLRVSCFLTSLKPGKPITMDTLKKTKVLAHRTGASEPAEHWTVHECLHAQFEDGDHVNVLSEGKWYRVAASLRQEVEQFYQGVDKRDALLPDYEAQDGSEEKYNARAAKRLGWELRDQKLFNNEAEFCDLYDPQHRLIVHVKRHGRSSQLSHLFMQGHNSARLLKRDPKFREFSAAVADPAADLDASQYTVVFAITSDSKGPLNIPFFSKLTLKNVCTELHEMGFHVALTKIEDRSSKTHQATAA